MELWGDEKTQFDKHIVFFWTGWLNDHLPSRWGKPVCKFRSPFGAGWIRHGCGARWWFLARDLRPEMNWRPEGNELPMFYQSSIGKWTYSNMYIYIDRFTYIYIFIFRFTYIYMHIYIICIWYMYTHCIPHRFLFCDIPNAWCIDRFCKNETGTWLWENLTRLKNVWKSIQVVFCSKCQRLKILVHYRSGTTYVGPWLIFQPFILRSRILSHFAQPDNLSEKCFFVW